MPPRICKGQLISNGSMSQVFQGICQNTGKVFAVKRLNDQNISLLNKELFLKEMEVWKGVVHPGLTRCFDVVFGPGNGYIDIIVEHVAGDTLKVWLAKWGALNEQLAKTFSKHIIAALVYLHERDLEHGELTTTNVICAYNGSVKVCDAATCIFRKALGIPAPLTQPHPPEILLGLCNPKNCEPIDHQKEMLSMESPWNRYCETTANRKPETILQRMQEDEAIYNNNKTSLFDQMIASCLAYSPQDRPDAISLLQLLDNDSTRSHSSSLQSDASSAKHQTTSPRLSWVKSKAKMEDHEVYSTKWKSIADMSMEEGVSPQYKWGSGSRGSPLSPRSSLGSMKASPSPDSSSGHQYFRCTPTPPNNPPNIQTSTTASIASTSFQNQRNTPPSSVRSRFLKQQQQAASLDITFGDGESSVSSIASSNSMGKSPNNNNHDRNKNVEMEDVSEPEGDISTNNSTMLPPLRSPGPKSLGESLRNIKTNSSDISALKELLNTTYIQKLGISHAVALEALRASETRVYSPNTLIFEQNSNPGFFYLVLSGIVNIVQKKKDSSEAVQITTVPQGEGFGDLALYLSCRRTATAIVGDKETELLLLNKSDFGRLFLPPLAAYINRVTSFYQKYPFFSEKNHFTMLELAYRSIPVTRENQTLLATPGCVLSTLQFVTKGKVEVQQRQFSKVAQQLAVFGLGSVHARSPNVIARADGEVHLLLLHINDAVRLLTPSELQALQQYSYDQIVEENN